jgi:hypothetical protein
MVAFLVSGHGHIMQSKNCSPPTTTTVEQPKPFSGLSLVRVMETSTVTAQIHPLASAGRISSAELNASVELASQS